MSHHPVLYQVNTRCWLAELSCRAGKRLSLADVPACELDFFVQSGFTHIWLTGVWTLGPRGSAWSRECYPTVAAELGTQPEGSPYAICSYDVAPTLGGDAGLATLRRRMNERGLRLILDFVPNHTALEHPWAETDPEFYITSPEPRHGFIKPHLRSDQWFAHGHCGFGAPWVDTLQLNYANPALRHAMVRELESVATKCDGVRCDMAMLVLRDIFARTWASVEAVEGGPEFWREAISAVRARQPEFLFLAEVYWDCEETLQHLGFDYTYNKRLYDLIVRREPEATARYLKFLRPEFLSRCAHFLENHDEPRIASLLSLPEHRAAAVLIATLPGLRFFHEGQLLGWRMHAHIHFAKRPPEAGDRAVTQFYQHLFTALKDTAVGSGTATVLHAHPAWPGNSTHERFALIQWTSATEREITLAVVNLGAAQAQCYAPVCIEGLSSSDWIARDVLGSEQHQRSGTELAASGFYLDLPPHAAQLFQFTPVGRASVPASPI